MKKYLLLWLLMAFEISEAQNLEWVRQQLGTFVVDNEGSMVIPSNFSGTYDFDPGPGVTNLTSVGGIDAFIIKYDATGNLVWVRRFGGAGNDIAFLGTSDDAGNIYVTGTFQGTADLDPGVGIVNFTAGSTTDVFVMKLDPNGNFVWAKTMGQVTMKAIKVTKLGEVYTTGYFTGTLDFNPGAGNLNLTSNGSNDIFIWKLDSNGNLAWAKNIGSVGDDNALSLAVDTAGNAYSTGKFQSTVDFDPNAGLSNLTSVGGYDVYVAKYSSTGNLVWAKNIGGTDGDTGNSMVLDSRSNIYITGNFNLACDFDPGAGTYNLTSNGSSDIFIWKLDLNGNFIWAVNIGSQFADAPNSIALDRQNNIYTTGDFSGVADFNPGAGVFNLTPKGLGDIFISKLDSLGNFIWAAGMGDNYSDVGTFIYIDNTNSIYLNGQYRDTVDVDPSANSYNLISGGTQTFMAKYNQRGVFGYIYNDVNGNCTKESNEVGLAHRLAVVNPGNLVVQTNTGGCWYIDSLPIGTYTITFDTTGKWSPTCTPTQTFTVTDPATTTIAPYFGFVTTEVCTQPTVSVCAPSLRWCFSDQYVYVHAGNSIKATAPINNSYVLLQLDPLLILQSALLPYTTLPNNTYRFDIGNLNPDQFQDFFVACSVSCNAVLLQTLCNTAVIYPVDTCALDTSTSYSTGVAPCSTPYDNSYLTVNGWCQSDTIHFKVSNKGSGNMSCYTAIRVYSNGTLISIDSVQLQAGDSAMYDFTGNGETWRMEADQHPRHPGLFSPSATVERCGNLSNWVPNLVSVLPPDDADPTVDISCTLVTGSYDPNDKTGYPLGVSQQHYIEPNTPIDYVIRFQNTGSDTAFTVIIRDTLTTDLDIFTVQTGAASHRYNFRIYDNRILEWAFYNIQLPDSNANEPASHGFVTFTVKQKPNLAPGTIINNTAGIYFDFNDVVLTNNSYHQIKNEELATNVQQQVQSPNETFTLYPNPATAQLGIQTSGTPIEQINIYNTNGSLMMQVNPNTNHAILNTETLPNGVYIAEIKTKEGSAKKRWIKM
ncbi:MAG: T9SS type A sorting domain-containing protein [Chitinophagales bacterium]